MLALSTHRTALAGARRPRAGAAPALAVACAVALLFGGAGCNRRIRNDPETRAVAALALRLDLTGLAPELHGAGRVVLRLMPESLGEAAEAQLAWERVPGGEVRFLPRPDHLPAETALFEELVADRYALSSFSLNARYERPGAPVVQVSLAGRLEGAPAFEVRAGQLVGLGRLALTVAPDKSFRFVQSAEDQAAVLASAQTARSDLGKLAIAQPFAAAAAPPASVAPAAPAAPAPAAPAAPAPAAPAPAGAGAIQPAGAGKP